MVSRNEICIFNVDYASAEKKLRLNYSAVKEEE